jgi:hypothetical protein
MNPPFIPNTWGNYIFSLAQLQLWVETWKPKQIAMTDGQFAHYAQLCKEIKRDFNNIPIVFIDAPQAAI